MMDQDMGLEYVFPLRPDRNVVFIIPRNLTIAEASRLATFIESIVMPPVPPPGKDP